MKKHLALLGLGTIGQAVFNELLATIAPDWQLDWVVVKHLKRHLGLPLPTTTRLTTDWHRAVNDPQVDVVIELIGGTTVAKKIVTTALQLGKQVITANKDLIATSGNELSRLAHDNGGALAYEAAVAGGIPIIRTIQESLAPDHITGISGILNGTSNYILTAIQNQGLTYQAALKQAQINGYAEANPTKDLNGIDASYKLIILVRLIFRSRLTLQQLSPQGIDQLSPRIFNVANHFQRQIKLVAQAQMVNGTLYAGVYPLALTPTHPLAQVNGVTNAITVDSDLVGSSTYLGPGAGGPATANSVLADLQAFIRNDYHHNNPCLPAAHFASPLNQPHAYLIAGKTTPAQITPPITPQALATYQANDPTLAWVVAESERL
ncbi:homoserine dehydrogenase [Lactobacillus alvi]|uniref:Homoserine dehydrogenase n=1 Tax=Limosilactobacillus alvi TaxID=990412 RepID=A0ABS2EM96_9LACO|nr:homoserine dehydrogenase [Limosilactobacillus alvi]MBM6753186.1 homoserine dehydrogenase [Limosilactobacillus alvi]